MPGGTNKRALPCSAKPRRSKRHRTNGFIRRRAEPIAEEQTSITVDEMPSEILVCIARKLPDLASVLRWSLSSPRLFAAIAANGLDRQVRERLIGGDDCPCLAVAPRLKDESRTGCPGWCSAKIINHRIATALRCERFLEGMSGSYAALRERALRRMDEHYGGRFAFTEDMLGSVESSNGNMNHLLGAIATHGIEALAYRAFTLDLQFQDLRRAVNSFGGLDIVTLPLFAWNYLPWTACRAEEDYIHGNESGWLRQVFPRYRLAQGHDRLRVEAMLGMVRTLRAVIVGHNTASCTVEMPHYHDDRHCAFNRASSPACRSTDSFAIHMRYQARVLRDVLERVRLRIVEPVPSTSLRQIITPNASCDAILHILASEGGWAIQSTASNRPRTKSSVLPAWVLVTDPAMCDVDFVDDFNLLDALWPMPRVPKLLSVSDNSFAFHLVSASLSDRDALFHCGEHGTVLTDHRSSCAELGAAVESLFEICDGPTNATIHLLSKAVCVAERSGLARCAGHASETVIRAIFTSGGLIDNRANLFLTTDNWRTLNDGRSLATKLVPMHRALTDDCDSTVALCVNAASLLLVLRRLQPEGNRADLGLCLANTGPSFKSVCEAADRHAVQLAKQILLLPLVALARCGALETRTNVESTRAMLVSLGDMGFRGAKELLGAV